jgi:hypothetical protein
MGILCAVFIALVGPGGSMTAADFPSLPESILESGPFAWPTDNHALLADTGAFHTAYEQNPTLGLPGYTRGCGHTFHEGIDIPPARAFRLRARVTVATTDCNTGESLNLTFPVWRPIDKVYAVCSGRVGFALDDPRRSNYGRYIVLEHRTPEGAPFVTLYAHLGELYVATGDRVRAGQPIAAMGQSSNEPTMRNWLAAFPHVHFEIGRLRRRNAPANSSNGGPVGGIYNGRNIQGYDPLEFLRRAFAAPTPADNG